MHLKNTSTKRQTVKKHTYKTKQIHNKPNQFLIQIKVYFFIIISSFIFCFVFFLLIKQLLSYIPLFCLFVSFLELKLYGNTPQLHYFSPFPKIFTMFFIYSPFNTILHFILKVSLFFTSRFISNLF